jgi:hypothetical protein
MEDSMLRLGLRLRTRAFAHGLALTALALGGCPMGDDGDDQATPDAALPSPDAARPASTHVGLISVQDMQLADAPQLGHGMTVTAFLTPAGRAPDIELRTDDWNGCQGWSYAVDAGDPPPATTDEGGLAVHGTSEPIPDDCVFRAGAYMCPIASGTATAAGVAPMAGGAAVYQLPGGAFTSDAAGRYLEVSGAANATNAGRFPIVAVAGPTTVVVGNPAAVAESAFAAAYTVLAGVGPVPNNPRDPIADGERVTFGMTPGGGGHFDFPDTEVVAGGAFRPDDATLALLRDLPIGDDAITLRCDGAGGDCGVADATLMLLRTSDGDTAGISPFALPPPSHRHVEIVCAVTGGDGSITIPAEAMALVAAAHAASPITRIRLAYMHDGVALARNPYPAAENLVRIGLGHGYIGFTDVPAR